MPLDHEMRAQEHHVHLQVRRCGDASPKTRERRGGEVVREGKGCLVQEGEGEAACVVQDVGAGARAEALVWGGKA